MTAQPPAGAQGEALWAMHIRGPDDLYPAPDYDTAVKWCDYVNYSAAPRSPDVMMAAVPAIWPYAPERHQDGLAGSVADWTLPLKADGTEQVIKPLYATPAQPDTGAVEALREALGELIKADKDLAVAVNFCEPTQRLDALAIAEGASRTARSNAIAALSTSNTQGGAG